MRAWIYFSYSCKVKKNTGDEYAAVDNAANRGTCLRGAVFEQHVSILVAEKMCEDLRSCMLWWVSLPPS